MTERHNSNTQDYQFVRIKGVMQMTGLSRSYIYALASQGIFPESVQLVPGGNSVAWVKSEVQEWLESRMNARSGETK